MQHTEEPLLGAMYSPLRQVMVQDKKNTGLLLVRRKATVSPHTMMLVSCVVIMLGIAVVTMGLVGRRWYTQDSRYWIHDNNDILCPRLKLLACCQKGLYFKMWTKILAVSSQMLLV